MLSFYLNSKGRRVSKAKLSRLKEKESSQNWNFQRDKGWRGVETKKTSWEGYGYFLKQVNKCRLIWLLFYK